MGAPGGFFPHTSWTVLKGCREGDEDRRNACLDRLIGLYWKPVYWTIRRSWTKTNEDAKDLTQEFFTKVVLESSFVDRASPNEGTFRSFLKGAVQRFLSQSARDGHALKRGGGTTVASLDRVGVDADLTWSGPEGSTPEEVFDRAWENVVLEHALQALEARLSSTGRGIWWKVFQAYDLSADKDVSYVSLGRMFGIPPATVKAYLAQTRKEMLSIARDILRDSVDSPADLDLELRTILEG